MKPLLIRALALIAWLLRTRRPSSELRRVLVIKPDHLGDLLLATPALTALRVALPDARIVGLVGPWARLIWERNPARDALQELPFPGFDRTATSARGLARLARLLHPYLLLARHAALLRRARYDAALILRDDHWWGAALAALAGIPRRVGHAHPLCAPLLTEALPYTPREHVTRQALAVVARTVDGGRWTVDGGPSTMFLPTEAEEGWADAWLGANLAPGERLIVIHPGTGGPSKHWPEERWPVVADALGALPGARVLLTGGPGEAALVERIAAGMRRAPLTVAGQTSFGQLAALLGRSALVLGVDSGPLHLAVSQGARSLHLFGPSDHERFGPWGAPAHNRVLRSGIFCSPCGVFSHCPRGTAGPECMALIDPGTVLTAARELLAG